MKHKKERALILISFLLLGTFGLFYSLNKSGYLNRFKADPLSPAYTRTLTAIDGPGESGGPIGMFNTENDGYCYSTASAQKNDKFLVLSATDSTRPGVLMNLTVINGIAEVRSTFTGTGNLYAIVTDTLFERFTPTAADLLTSGVKKQLTNPGGFLLVLTDSLTPIEIESIEIGFHCNNDNDQNFFFEPGVNHYYGARSLATNIQIYHDGLSFTTNPTDITNNYSGETVVPPATRPNAWYRWNGISMRNYSLDGTTPNYTTTRFGEFYSSSFEISVTAIVDPGIFYNTDEWFCVAPWVSLSASNIDRTDPSNRMYLQTYIGNDNYDPIGTVNTLYKPYWAGRFITNYEWDAGSNAWVFQDPDTVTVLDDPTTTLREAYEAVNLPIFNVTYQISGNIYKIFINGFWVYTNTLLETYTDETFSLETFELQAVNYGNPDGTAKAGHMVIYSNPIIRTI